MGWAGTTTGARRSTMSTPPLTCRIQVCLRAFASIICQASTILKASTTTFDILGLHALQVRPELVHVLLRQVAEQERAVGRLRPW
jgi:hypothetical protein